MIRLQAAMARAAARAALCKPMPRAIVRIDAALHATSAPAQTSPLLASRSHQQQQEEDGRARRSRRLASALVSGGLAVALAAALAASAAPLDASSSADSPPNRSPPPASPAWLGDRMAEAAAAGDTARLASLLANYKPAEGVNLAHRFGWTPLHAAVAGGHADTVRFILSRPECQVNKPDRYTPRAHNLDGMVLKHSARQDAFPELYPSLPANGMAALHYAALFAPMEIVDALIEAGADLDQKEAQGFTPDRILDFSSMQQQEEDQGASGATGVDPNLAAKRAHHAEVVARIAAAREAQAARRAQQEKEDRIRFPLELKLKKEMIGQEIPILSVFDASKPLVFLFLGSSGVGKTMLAKLLAQHVVKDEEDGFIRIDMSEFQAKHEMSRLIGSPPGYVGHESGGQLTEKLEKCPKAVVLLDEVEKAHPDILTLLLAVFDEGRLTDGKGKTIHCPQAIFVMTSNVVQEEIRDALESGYELRPQQSILEDLHRTTEQMRTLGGITTTPLPPPPTTVETPSSPVQLPATADESGMTNSAISTTILPGAMPVTPIDEPAASPSSPEALSRQLAKLASDTERFLRFIVHPILKRAFKRDEFIGRINDTILFHPFSKQDLEQTVTMELNRWAQRAKERHNIELSFSPALVDSLTLNYDERYGYRSVIYAVERRVVNVLASAHERDLISSGCQVSLDLAEHPTHTGQQPPVVIRDVKRPANGNGNNNAERKKFFGIF